VQPCVGSHPCVDAHDVHLPLFEKIETWTISDHFRPRSANCVKGKQQKNRSLSMAAELRSMERMAPLKNVMIPLQSLLTPSLPASGKPDDAHNPFPDKPITIRAFGDKIDVLQSLMQPVVIRILGSNGSEYKFLCKPKDDLRKDR
jgi:serine/threonine-protein kinase ATR